MFTTGPSDVRSSLIVAVSMGLRDPSSGKFSVAGGLVDELHSKLGVHGSGRQTFELMCDFQILGCGLHSAPDAAPPVPELIIATRPAGSHQGTSGVWSSVFHRRVVVFPFKPVACFPHAAQNRFSREAEALKTWAKSLILLGDPGRNRTIERFLALLL